LFHRQKDEGGGVNRHGSIISTSVEENFALEIRSPHDGGGFKHTDVSREKLWLQDP
jgi:hypothetical protein